MGIDKVIAETVKLGSGAPGFWFCKTVGYTAWAVAGWLLVQARANALLLVCKKTKVLTLVSLWMDQD